VLIAKFHQIGPKWVEIGKLLSGRSGNNVKNRWYKHLCKTDIGATAPPSDAAVGQKALGPTDTDWPKLFASTENPLQIEWHWATGNSTASALF
jgi:hypothetical protein